MDGIDFRILKNIWCNRTTCCCIVCPGTTLHICTNIQMWGAPSALVQLVPWLSLPVCELQTKIGVSQGIKLGSSKAPLPLLQSHLFSITEKKKKKPQKNSPHIRRPGSFDKMTYCSSQHSSQLSFPGCIKLPQPPSKWLAPPGTRRARHPSSTVTLRQRWRSDRASITAAILSFYPHKIIIIKKKNHTTVARWLSLTLAVRGLGWGGGGSSAYPHQSKWD